MEHTGMDFLAGLGNDVLATADGRVVNVSRSARGRGNVVEIEHNYRIQDGICPFERYFCKKGTIRGKRNGYSPRGIFRACLLCHIYIMKFQQKGQVRDPVHYYFMEVMPGNTDRSC